MISGGKHLLAFPWPVHFTVISGVVFCLLAGCRPVSPASSTSQPQTTVAIQLSWTSSFQDAPFYAAERNGHFEDQNLTVTLLNGGFRDGEYINAIDQVVNGTADFGITDAYNLILARADDKPVVAIMAIYQRSPAALISLADRNIARPQDLIGRRVALTTGAIAWTYNAMLNAQGIAEDQVDIVSRTSFGIEPLLSGEVDAMSGWIINEGIMVEEAGYKANFIVMSDYSTDTYSLVLFTTESMIDEQSYLVERIVNGTLAGMQDVINNPEQAAKWIVHDNDLDMEEQHRRIQASLPFLNPDGSQPGWMRPQVWESTYQILRNQNILTESLDIEEAYDLTFLQASQ